jgi:hypothetical protein
MILNWRPFSFNFIFGNRKKSQDGMTAIMCFARNFDAHSPFLSLIHHGNRHRSRIPLHINACENCPRSPSYVQLGTITH